MDEQTLSECVRATEACYRHYTEKSFTDEQREKLFDFLDELLSEKEKETE